MSAGRVTHCAVQQRSDQLHLRSFGTYYISHLFPRVSGRVINLTALSNQGAVMPPYCIQETFLTHLHLSKTNICGLHRHTLPAYMKALCVCVCVTCTATAGSHLCCIRPFIGVGVIGLNCTQTLTSCSIIPSDCIKQT